MTDERITSGRGITGLFRRIKRLAFDVLGRPYFHVEIIYDDKRRGAILAADWNIHFIRYLDANGYHDIPGHDAKVDAYIKNMYAEFSEDEERDI